MMKLPSVTAFFPAFNDAGTIPTMVMRVLLTLPHVADDYEVIVVNDGSEDYTAEMLKELARVYPQVRIIHHDRNLGYGAALRTGFSSATKDWIFYTDGDAQYDPGELVKLVQSLRSDTDIVNGYKIERHDPLHRAIIGRVYHHIVRLMFGFRLRDVDCDYRLIRRRVFDHIELTSTSGTICLEMVKKFQDGGHKFAEVPVHHYHRAFGKSQFFNFPRLFRTGVQLVKLWWELVGLKILRRANQRRFA
jgi:glycosyltransferase involved in cell wall biosynthesis